MSVQRKPQNREKLHRGVNPRKRARSTVEEQLRLATNAGIDLNHDLDTRDGLIASGILREGVNFSMTPRERQDRRARMDSES